MGGDVLYNGFLDLLTNVPTIPNRTQIPQETIRSLADQIVALFHPQKIILFGSYAYGTPRPESDVDLLVINVVEAAQPWITNYLILNRQRLYAGQSPTVLV
jgi:hypothetical protein